MSRRRRLLLGACRGLLVGWLLFILAGLHLPPPSAVSAEHQETVRAIWTSAADIAEQTPGPDIDHPLLSWLADDKVLHLFLFIPLGLLWALARRLARRPVLMVVFCGLSAIAIASELVQHLGGRIAELGDVVSNIAGGTIGLGLAVAAVELGRRARDSLQYRSR